MLAQGSRPRANPRGLHHSLQDATDVLLSPMGLATPRVHPRTETVNQHNAKRFTQNDSPKLLPLALHVGMGRDSRVRDRIVQATRRLLAKQTLVELCILW